MVESLFSAAGRDRSVDHARRSTWEVGRTCGPQPEPAFPLLRQLGGPGDLRRLDATLLPALAGEIREFLVAAVCRTGGHLGPNLGAVELTIALHRVFDSPTDRIVWDTGHQAYVHKILTGRWASFTGLRKRGGLSGYPSSAESDHDIVENSHASTALSYADGLAKAYALRGESRRVVAVVGDGALTGGMAWEALNNIAAGLDRPTIVVLNDNGRSYTETVGGLAEHLAGLRGAARRYSPTWSIFAGLGLAYLGPVDGHDIGAVESALRRAKDCPGPVVVHCVTRKGNGYAPAEDDEADRLDPRTGRPSTPASGRTWTSVFSEEMLAVARDFPRVVGITAAMLHPVGLDRLARAEPERVFDVGIAEQHATTSAAGLAMGGLHPVVAVYATFLNRALDQVLMDVALHRCGVTFVLDRAGITGDDGASHNGMWDLSLLQLVPGLRIAAPRDAAQLRAQLREAIAVEDAPTVVRFPKGTVGPDIPAVDRIGGLDLLRHAGPGGAAPSADVLLIAVGAMAATCVEVADRLSAQGVSVTVADPRWVKPVDPAIAPLAASHVLVVTVEDNGRVGGVGAAVAQALRDAGVHTPLRDLGIPQRFLDHGTRAEVLAEAGLTPPDITREILEALAGIRRAAPPAAPGGHQVIGAFARRDLATAPLAVASLNEHVA
jgi:1-deoxy-D-xylulose-5-phosphate synthase